MPTTDTLIEEAVEQFEKKFVQRDLGDDRDSWIFGHPDEISGFFKDQLRNIATKSAEKGFLAGYNEYSKKLEELIKSQPKEQNV